MLAMSAREVPAPMELAWIGIACGFGLALCALLLAAPVRLEVEYRRSGADQIHARVRALYGLVRVHWHWSSDEQDPRRKRAGQGEGLARSESDERGRPSLASLRTWRTFGRRALSALDRMAPHVHVHELRFEARMGAGESVRTGMLVGTAYAALYTLLGWLSHRVRMHRVPTVSIAPAFQDALLIIYARSIVRIRTGYVIAAGIRLLTAWKRRAS